MIMIKVIVKFFDGPQGTTLCSIGDTREGISTEIVDISTLEFLNGKYYGTFQLEGITTEGGDTCVDEIDFDNETSKLTFMVGMDDCEDEPIYVGHKVMILDEGTVGVVRHCKKSKSVVIKIETPLHDEFGSFVEESISLNEFCSTDLKIVGASV